MERASWLNGTASLRRNYADLAFCPQNNAADLQAGKQRTLARLGPALARFKQFHTGMPDTQSAPYADAGLLIPDFDKLNEAAFLADDESGIYVLINAEEHLIVKARGPADGMGTLVQKVRRMEAALTDPRNPFAFHERFGYLSYRPQLAGSGLYLSVLLHLPMLSFVKQVRKQDAVPDEFGCVLQPLGGNPAFNPSRLFSLTNAKSQGLDDDQILDSVLASAESLDRKEESLRQKGFSHPRASSALDQAWRSYGILMYARKLIPNDFLTHWSSLRLGAAAGILPITLDLADSLLPLAMNGRFIAQGDDPATFPFRRADEVRRILSGG